MSVPLEHDYIGLSDASRSSVESSNISSDSETNNVLNLKATELSLGLPGFSKNFEEPVSVAKNFMLGAKRGFSDVNLDVNGCFEKVQGQKGNLVDGVVKAGEEKKKDVVPSA
nr:auxin-responsive protein IAA27-like [Tanacetum cinerariifolium]